ncbi:MULTISPECIES: DUF5758 domain-containing protein [Vagococcus]|uniref:Pentapeptide repeat family protein n=1 Tax=Vagococcus fluvialis bH819 TaxID=1255619 RepID=A0A1X6WNE7_9ENTE|nr:MULTISPECIES: DUF5758 domain-containing protein [Vagococcus]SLM85851.1 hypothetical protein FM121_07100 [Vagococcus fluvialis bH819]
MSNFINQQLTNKDFSNENLSYFDFSNTICCSCDFSSTNLKGAIFLGATLNNCCFNHANVDQTNFRHSLIVDCQLDNLKNKEKAFYLNLSCPETGAFIAYKQCMDFRMVQLLIPSDAKRSSATNNTCRCDKAKVLSIKNIDYTQTYDDAQSLVDENFIYHQGEWIYSDYFCDNRWIDSTYGIHFYMTREEAIDYLK